MVADPLDASLQEVEAPTSPLWTRQSSVLHSEPATEEDLDEDSDGASAAGGYSPPAWRRLGNGDRSSGFWRGPRNDVLAAMPPPRPSTRESSPELENSENEGLLERAIRTRLPHGSQSPEKGRSPSPEADDPTVKAKMNERADSMLVLPARESTPADNCQLSSIMSSPFCTLW